MQAQINVEEGSSAHMSRSVEWRELVQSCVGAKVAGDDEPDALAGEASQSLIVACPPNVSQRAPGRNQISQMWGRT